MAESKEELKSLLMRLKEQREKTDLKVDILKIKIKASGPITSWQIGGGNVIAVINFIFLGCKITGMVTAAMKLKDTFSLEDKL